MDIFSHGFIGKVIYPAKIVKQDQNGTIMGFTVYVDGLGKDVENKFTAGKINCSYFCKDPAQDRFALAIANVYHDKANPNAYLGEMYKSVKVAVNGQLSLKEVGGEGGGVYVNLTYVKGMVIDDKVNAMLKNIFAKPSNDNQGQAPQQQQMQQPQQQQPVYAPGMQPPPQVMAAPQQFVPQQQQQQQQQYVQQPQTQQYVQAPSTALQQQPQYVQTPVESQFVPHQPQQPQYVQPTQAVQQPQYVQQQQVVPQQQEQVIIHNPVPQVQPANQQDVNNIQNALGNSLPSAVMPTM
jgi:hypothetical protein